jgi:hypothetical protein
MAENWTPSARKDLEISRSMTHRSTMIAECSATAIERWA